MRPVIGISGNMGAGKSTIQTILTSDLGYTPLSFASGLKDTVAALFEWDRSMLEGSTEESRAWRERPDQFWTDVLTAGDPSNTHSPMAAAAPGGQITPRFVLQYFGTEVVRTHVSTDFWALAAKRRAQEMMKTEKSIVFSDVRFDNEATVIRELGGVVWRVTRKNAPACANARSHASEQSLGCPIDWEVDNNGTIDDLRKAIVEHLSL